MFYYLNGEVTLMEGNLARIGRGAWDSKEQYAQNWVRMRVFNTYAQRGDCSG